MTCGHRAPSAALIASLAGSAVFTAAAHAEHGKTPIALEWQRAAGLNTGHVYLNMSTGERVFNHETPIGSTARGTPPWYWSTTVPDPCLSAAGIPAGDQGVGVFTGIMSETNGDAQQANAVRLWQNWFDAPADTIINGLAFQFYTGLQDPGFTPGQDPAGSDPAGIPGYEMIMVFTENDDPASQSTAVAHSPILVTDLPGANDSDGSGVIEFAEGVLWTFFLDISDTPIEIADSDNSSGNPQGSDGDAPGTVGEGSFDCGFAVTFRQPGVAEGDLLFRDNPLIDFSGVDLTPETGIGNPDGQAPDLSTFPNILPTGTGLYAPSERLETFAATAGVITQWPVDTSVLVDSPEGLGSWDAMEIFDATGADESGSDFIFYFGGFACLTPGGGVDGYENPYSAFYMQFNIDAVAPGGCWGGAVPCNTADIADPFGVLDLADINRFVADFVNGDTTCTDFAAPDGVLDLADINAFIVNFLGGCP